MKYLLLVIGVPPMFFLYCALFGWLIHPVLRRAGRLAVLLGLTGLAILAMPAVAGTLMVALERDLPLVPPPDRPPAAIVILGGDVARSAIAPFTLPGRLTLDRLRAGAALHRRTGLPILVTGGTVQPDRPPVAAVMADSLRDDFQTPVAWTETASNDTWENAAFSAAILKQQGIASVYIVSHGWHLRRAMIAFRAAGLIATAVPTSLEPPVDPIASDFVPLAGTWQWSYYAIHEWIGCVFYAAR